MKRVWAALGVRGKQLVVSVALVVVAVGVFGVIAERSVEHAVVARIEDELWREAGAASIALKDSADVDAAADALGDSLGVRVTVVDKGGRVVGDSSLDGHALDEAGDHNDRPEIKDARAVGRGVARRKSATVAIDSLYVARVAGDRVVRLSLPLHAVDEALSTLRGFFGIAALVALAIAVVGASVASHAVSRRLRALLAAARAVRSRAEERSDEEESDDVDDLARTFDSLTRELEKNLHSLADERDRFDGLLQAMGEGVVALDDDGKVVLCNRAGQALLGLGDKPVLGQRLAVPSLEGLIDNALDGVGGSAEVEVVVGAERPLRVLVRATVTARAGAGVVLVVHDVSDVRRLETLRKDFVANVSHELRTPCSVILANAETLLNGALDDGVRAHKFVEAVHRNAERLSRLIADLLELSKIEAGKAVFTREPVNLREAIEHVVDAVDPRAREKGHAVSVDVDETLAIEGDPKALDQVLINLVDNAVKYTPAGGNVHVSASRHDNVARLVIEDDGPGVEGKHKERLFERFYRVDSGRSRDVGGTGLGLAIVKHLVEAMDGTVGVEDAVPHGTRFWVELPLAGTRADASRRGGAEPMTTVRDTSGPVVDRL